jgi:hypothetical protein
MGCSCDDMITRHIFTRKSDLGGRSTRVPGLSLQMIRSPSQWPGAARSSASAGRSLIITMGRRSGAGGRLRRAQGLGEFSAALDVEGLVDHLVDHVRLRTVGEGAAYRGLSRGSLRHTAGSPGRPPRGRRTTRAVMCRTRMRPHPDRRYPPRERQTGTATRPRLGPGRGRSPPEQRVHLQQRRRAQSCHTRQRQFLALRAWMWVIRCGLGVVPPVGRG